MSLDKPRRKRAAYGLPPNPVEIVATANEIQALMSHGINADGSLKPNIIRALLKFKGQDMKSLAELHGYTDGYFHQVVNRVRRDITVENVIAEALGFDPERVWARRANPAA